jgi:hypothetical protein
MLAERRSDARPKIWLCAAKSTARPGTRGMRPTGVEPATFGLKDRRSLGPRKDPLTTELRALPWKVTRAAGFERRRGWGRFVGRLGG